MPVDWNELYKMLANKGREPSGSRMPSSPLILAAWHVTTPIQKQQRFKEHIQWASDNQQLDEIGSYLRSLAEDQWCHFGEL